MSGLIAGLVAMMAVAMAGEVHADVPKVAPPAAPSQESATAPPAPGGNVPGQAPTGQPETSSKTGRSEADPSEAAGSADKSPAQSGTSAHPPARSGEPAKYTLRYKFQPGQTLRWEVIHRARVETSIAGVSQTVETYSKSIKVWRVTAVGPEGNATFENSVEQVEMRQKSTGRMERHYNSQTDKSPPPEFRDVAQSIGVPLWAITLDPRGKIVKRQILKAKPGTETQGQITLPLPEEPVAVGHTWSLAFELELAGNDGTVKKVKIQQRFTLERVEAGIATIRVSSQVLTPIRDPAHEALLVQREPSGLVRFDLQAGRVIEEQMDIDKEVVGFAGKASTMHYRTRVTEKYLGPTDTGLSGGEATASRPATPDAPHAAKR